MKFDFEGQTAIVTGGTRGIGKSISEAFLNAGAKVIATYRSNKTAAQEFKEANSAHADNLDLQSFDVSNADEVTKFFEYVDTNYPSLEILVNNSGIRKDQVLAMMKENDWNAVIDTNLSGTYLMSKPAVKSMMRKRYGRIITITSPIGRLGFPGQANYAASKAGQVALTQSLSKEVASRGITVNCVSPGFIETDFIEDLPEKQKEGYLGLVPLKRFGTPEEVAHCVLFLADRGSAYITGSVLEITGGI